MKSFPCLISKLQYSIEMKTFATFVLGHKDSSERDVAELVDAMTQIEGFNKKFNFMQTRVFLNGKVLDSQLLVIDRLYTLYSQYRREQHAKGLY